ncbi:MAG TPA: hypothetical protein VNZ52_10555 [Candidatus Thermoplasmatota archaeon]|nr:hypothetical protein [Candidatus Thermoplasmatota archaeon]
MTSATTSWSRFRGTRLRALALVLALLLAGCLAAEQQPPAAESPSTGPEVIIDETRPDTASGTVATGPAAAADANATLDAPPVLVPGEWWRVHFTFPSIGVDVELVRVVAAVDGDTYVIGMPHEGWFKEAIAYHSPGFGDIAKDLSYPIHNEVFQPVKFPLTVGATWQTSFVMTPYEAKVESIEGTKAHIVLTPQGESDAASTAFGLLMGVDTQAPMRITYDAGIHEVSRFETSAGSYEVVAHGYGYEGWVTIPRAMHTAIDYGRFGPATPGEHPVSRTVEVEGGYNRMTLMHAIFAMGPGAYRIRAVAPDGTEFVTEHTGGGGFALQFYEVADPDGSWLSEDVVAGPGGTYSMGIAYHQYDIQLPSGARRSDHSHEVVR